MPFGVVSGVGRGMGVLDGVEIVEGEGAVFGVNVVFCIVTIVLKCTVYESVAWYRRTDGRTDES